MGKHRAFVARLALGYQVSQVLFAAHNLRLFTLLEEAAGDVTDLALRSGAHAPSLERLLRVLLDLKLVEKREGIYYNTEPASCCLAEGGNGFWGSTLHHAGNLWWFWEDLDQRIVSGRGREPDAGHLQEYPHRLGDYLAAMDEAAQAKTDAIAGAIGIHRFRHMLDMGCGPGTYALAFAGMNPGLLVTALDLQPSLDVLEKRLRTSSLRERITTHVCEVVADAIPGAGYDLVFISQLIHLYAEDEVEIILRKAWNALASPGELVIHDYLLGEEGDDALYASLFDLTMLVGTPRGRCYSRAELAAMLGRLQPAQLRQVPLEMGTALVVAGKGEAGAGPVHEAGW